MSHKAQDVFCLGMDERFTVDGDGISKSCPCDDDLNDYCGGGRWRKHNRKEYCENEFPDMVGLDPWFSYYCYGGWSSWIKDCCCGELLLPPFGP